MMNPITKEKGWEEENDINEMRNSFTKGWESLNFIAEMGASLERGEPLRRPARPAEPARVCCRSTTDFIFSVLGCIGTDFCIQILIFQHFSRSTRLAYFCTAQVSKCQFKTVQKCSDFYDVFNILLWCIFTRSCKLSTKHFWISVGILRKCS